MSLFHHPHLTRGIVHTARGAFALNRGIADVPDDIGHSLGWLPVNADGLWTVSPVQGPPPGVQPPAAQELAPKP